MMRHSRLEHRFVRQIPDHLEPGVLYVSMEYGTAVHSCCCGCGQEVVTPFTPTDWRMTFDGETVSLRPSVGNWNLPCRSHYVIDRGRAIEAGPWSEEQIMAERSRDKAAKASYYGMSDLTKVAGPDQAPIPPIKGGMGLWSQVNRWLSRLV